jgi:hypothetical protein
MCICRNGRGNQQRRPHLPDVVQSPPETLRIAIVEVATMTDGIWMLSTRGMRYPFG